MYLWAEAWPKANSFSTKAGVPFAAPGMAEVKELPHREIAGMRCHKVEKTRFGFGIAESGEVGELGFVNAHGLQAENRRAQFPIVSNTTQSVRIATPAVDLEAGAGLLCQPARAVMVGGEF